MDAYYTSDSATLYRGDALAVLAELPDASVDAVVTDPPYSSGGQYRGDRMNGRMTQGRFANNCEYVAWGTAGGRDLDASATLGGFFQVNAPRDRDHITQKPIAVMRELVQIVKVGDTILDPFAGSGTTGVAALIEGRRFIGVEMNAHHVETAANRLRTAALQPSGRDEQDALDLSELVTHE